MIADVTCGRQEDGSKGSRSLRELESQGCVMECESPHGESHENSWLFTLSLQIQIRC